VFAGYTIILRSTFVAERMNRNLNKKVSIALCTYNGERFLQEQLESIAAQTVVPFELVICDDVSSDSTREILEKFAANANFSVRLYFNSENLGFVKNFEKAISLCNGDIIFLSDQDDVWRTDKIEVMQKYFADPKIGMVFSNANTIDQRGNSLARTLWESAYFTEEMQNSFRYGDAYKTLYLKTIVSGCTMAFSRQLWPYIKPLPTDILFIHDAWIAMMASLFAEVVIIDEPLINYRIHEDQSVALKGRKFSVRENISDARSGKKSEHYQKHLNQLNTVRQRLQKFYTQIPIEKSDFLFRCMEEHEKHLAARVYIPQNRFTRYFSIINELGTGRYHRFSNGFRSAFADLLKDTQYLGR